MQNAVFAVVVTFNPVARRFTESLRRLRNAVGLTIVVDNASSVPVEPMIEASGNDAVEVLHLAHNTGVGAGQNAGIERAIALGARFVLLLDQDSAITEGMVDSLLMALHSAEPSQDSRPVAAVGPSYVDNEGRRDFFVPVDALWPRTWRPRTSRDSSSPRPIETSFLLASGTLIPVKVFGEIGGMHSDYFIDHVDREWCFRAVAAGFRLYGVPEAILEHEVGTPLTCAFGGVRVRYRWHPSLRNYYMFRNALLMVRDTHVPLRWKAYLAVRLLRYAVGTCLLMERRLERATFIAKGIVHGFYNVRGRYDEASGQCSPLPPSSLDKPGR